MSQAECIFCKIIQGELPCAKVYETDTVLSFLDINPVLPGHALVIPKAHHPTLFELPPALGQDLIEALRVVGGAIMKVTGAPGLNVWQNNFEEAGQLVFHVHFHLIPRFADDGLSLWPQKPYDEPSRMAELAGEIQAMIRQGKQ